MSDLAVVLPALDESSSIGNVISRIFSVLPYATVVVVDDASSDDTASVAKEAGARVLTLATRLGSWGALQTGFRLALAEGYEIVITMDSDGQHLPEMIPVLINRRNSSGANIIIGSAPSRGSLLRKIAWRMMQFSSGLKVADPTSGFRVYDRNALELLSGKQSTYLEHQDVGVLALALHNNLTITEASVEMRTRLAGRSRIFDSWPTVAFYMLNTLLLGFSKRPFSRKDGENNMEETR